jgi:hypothetical protein
MPAARPSTSGSLETTDDEVNILIPCGDVPDGTGLTLWRKKKQRPSQVQLRPGVTILIYQNVQFRTVPASDIIICSVTITPVEAISASLPT